MKKTIYTAVLFLIFGMATTSCKKDSTTNTNAKESAFSSTFNSTNHESWLANRDFETGFTFKTSKAGKILQLGAMLETGSYKISLWDFDSKLKLDSVNVTVIDSTKFSYASITPRSIVANKKYVVSIHTLNGKITFINLGLILPFTIGSITITEGCLSNIPAYGPFPEQFVRNDEIMGVPDIIFQAD